MTSPLDEILKLQPTLHGAGTVSSEALAAIARHAGARQIRRSVETGCGATTLLLSHLSERHTVFTLDVGESVANVRQSPMLRPGVVDFIEGPSQRTLPQYVFAEKLQLAILDGPHAYPFPDLEYYFLYPHLEENALLILDDIHIPTIHNLFDFLRADAMFRFDEVVRTTAFFTRTAAPTFDPLGDGWGHQAFNRRTLLRYDWRSRRLPVCLDRCCALCLPFGIAMFVAEIARSRFSCRREGGLLTRRVASRDARTFPRMRIYGFLFIARMSMAGGLKQAVPFRSATAVGRSK